MISRTEILTADNRRQRSENSVHKEFRHAG